METGIDTAIRLAGSQTALASIAGVTPQAVQKWAKQGVVPPERCRLVESHFAGQVTRYQLNPIVFGEAPEPATQ